MSLLIDAIGSFFAMPLQEQLKITIYLMVLAFVSLGLLENAM